MDYNTIINDDCLHAMQGLEDNSIDSIVTDPPYGLSFMGRIGTTVFRALSFGRKRYG